MKYITNVLQIIHPDNRSEKHATSVDVINYGYDQDSLLTSAGDLTLASDPQNGLLQGTSLDQITDTFIYNPFGEPEVYQASFNASSLFQQSFERDKLGHIIRQTDTIQGITRVYDYGYDLAGRLETVTVDGTLQSTYVYDNQDRLLSYGANTYDTAPMFCLKQQAVCA